MTPLSQHRTLWLSILTVIAVAVLPAFAQGISGRKGFELPMRTDAGTWEGTWYYVNREAKVAVWIRQGSEGPEVKLRYLNTGRGEGFETDWQGHADYSYRGKLGDFRLELTERGDKTIRGNWNWELRQGETARIETAKVTMFRAGDGRALVVNFEDLKRYVTTNPAASLAYAQVWTFRKASNNQRLWEELAF